MNTPILDVRQLGIQLNNEYLLHPLDFSIQPGEVVGLVGESGSGKTLTSMAIVQLLDKNLTQSGSIQLDGQELTTMSDKQLRQIRGRDITFIMQNPMTAFSPLYTIGNQFIEHIRKHTTCSKKDASARAIQALAEVNLPNPSHIMNQYAFQLSGGMLQRTMIAFAAALSPQLIIADEPTTALDLYNQMEVLKHLEYVRKTQNTAILLISHDLSVIAEMADRVLVMEKGHLVEIAEVHELFDNPKHAYTKHLLASRLVVDMAGGTS